MKKSITKIVLLTTIYVLLIYVNTVFGAYSCELEFEPDKTEIKPGEKITYTLKVKNINAEDGIVMLNAKLEYNKDLFECSIVPDEDGEWEISEASLIEDEFNMHRKTLEASSKDQEITKIIFTAKTNITEGIETVSLTNINFTMNNDKSFEIEDKNAEIKIVLNDSDEDTQDTEEEEEEEKNESEEEIEENSEEEILEVNDNEGENEIVQNTVIAPDATTSNLSTLPYTGIVDTIKIITIILAIGSAIFFYKKHDKWKKV